MPRNDVLIIGAGPSGLFAAAELARHGVPARLIEKDLQPHREARATAIQPGTLEILESVGLLPAFLSASEHMHDTKPLEQMDQRWSQLVKFSHNLSVDPLRADLPAGGTIMVRPDGHIGFRFPSATADAFSVLDHHLGSYLVPESDR